MTLEELLVLPDDRLTELCAVEAMGWTRHRMLEPRSDYYSDPQQDWYYTVWVSQWNPLTDMNQAHAVIERKREEWAKAGSHKWWRINDAPAWEVAIMYEIESDPLAEVNHFSLARNICALAVWDSLQGKGEAG